MILRVFPRRTSLTPTDDLAFVGDPPLFRPAAVSAIHVSVTFTWDKAEGERLAGAWSEQYPGVPVYIGGPACGNKPYGFVPGLYIRQGVTFTTRGCNNACPWCLVPGHEGKLAEIEDFAPGYIVQDNNILQASRVHLMRVGGMLRRQRRAAVFSGGIDTRELDDWRVNWLRRLRISELYLAADTVGSLPRLREAISKLPFLTRRKLRVYVMVGYNGEMISEATARLEEVWAAGGLPFCQLYQPADHWISYSQEWKRLARTWSRPAAMFALHS